MPSDAPRIRPAGFVGQGAVPWPLALFFFLLSMQPASCAGAAPERAGAQRTQSPIGMFVLAENTVEFAEVFAYDADALETACAQASPLPAGVRCIELPGGLDHVVAGTGLRNLGYGTIGLRGIPPGAVLVAAWIYWGVIQDVAIGPAPSLRLGGVLVPGELVGSTTDPCWVGAGDFHAYRASVTELLQPMLNGDYSISHVPSAIVDGRSVWEEQAMDTPPLAEGASLVVVYSHAAVARTSRVYLSEGPATLISQLRVEHPMSLGLPPMTELRQSRIGGGGQTTDGAESTAPFMTFLGNIDLVQIRGPGSELNPNSDWQGAAAGPFQQLWDNEVDELLSTSTDLSELGFYTLGGSFYHVEYFLKDLALPEGASPGTDDEVLADCVAVVAHGLTAK
ncbi:MAG: hypothetical protein AAF657_17630 [Acidobacteriota bacterium]